jgi:hypothetical protein
LGTLKPEKRPLPIRLYNRIFNIVGARDQLDADKLLKKAISKTGLQFLGSDFNEDALRVLINSINEEAQLHPFGRLMIREKLVGQLENRLWAEHWFKQDPEILEQPVLPIYLITGLQRTGTTKMQRLLSSQEGARALMSWEALYPAPIRQAEESKKRIGRTQRNERAVNYISPAFQAIHPIHAHEPEEDVLLLDIHFMSSSMEAIMHLPGYAKWLERQDHSEAYRYEKKLLQLLQWQRGGSFWVLKSPHHLQYLQEFKEIFPETQIIWMHREIQACVPSFLSMLYYSRAMFTKHVSKSALKSHWLIKLSLMVEGGVTYREKHPTHIIDVDFHRFVSDEHHELKRILNTTGREFHGPGIVSNYSSRHKYSLSDWDITSAELNSRFADYGKLLNRLRNKHGK